MPGQRASGCRRSAAGTGRRAGRRAGPGSACAAGRRPARSPAACPSSARQMPTTALAVSASSANPGRTAAARSANSRTAGIRRARSAARRRRAAGERRRAAQRLAGDAERLAAGGQDPQPRAARPAAGRPAAATASMRCSQLSRTSSSRWPPSAATSRSSGVPRSRLAAPARRDRSRGCRARPAPPTPRRPAGHRRQRHEPRRPRSCRQRPEASMASLVLPTPPGPVSVTSRAGEQAPTRASSSSRPTKLVSCDGRLPCARHAPRSARSARQARRAGWPGGPRQLGGRVDPELVGERGAALVRGDRLGLAAGGVQRAHELAAQPFAQRVGGEQLARSSPTRRSLAEGQVGLDPLRQDAGAQLLQPGDRSGGERRAGDVGERGSAPQVKGTPQRLGTDRGVALGSRAADQTLERDGVDLPGFDREPVAAGPGLDGVVQAPREAARRAPAARWPPRPAARHPRGRRSTGRPGPYGRRPRRAGPPGHAAADH